MVASGKSLELFPPVPGEGQGMRSGAETAPIGSALTAAPPAATVQAVPARELWLALHLPNLPVEALLAGKVGDQDARVPLAVVESVGQRQVVACNVAAARAGVTAGMGINAACALTRQLRIHERQPAIEQLLLERLARWAGRFTPRVSLEPPDAVLLEIRGSCRLFGGLDSLIAQVKAGMAGQSVTPWTAVAPTPDAALWCARAGEQASITSLRDLPSRLARLPLTVLRWPDAAVSLLASMGVHHVGDCLRLPRDGFARRLGPERLLELDRATGRLPGVRRDFRPQVRFRGKRDFEDEITQGDWLLERLQSLVDDLAEFLEARQAGVQSLRVQVLHRTRQPTRHVFRFASLATQREHFLDVMKESLSRLQLEAPARGVKMQSGPLLMSAPASRSFFFAGRPVAPEHVARLIEKLEARLGPDALYRLQAIADHRPEHAWRKVGSWQAGKGTGPVHPGHCRPLWLLSDPQRLKQAGGWPVHEGPLDIRRGPERIEAGWWAGKDVARDYYVASTAAGIHLWIYRDREAPHDWFLHGIFG